MAKIENLNTLDAVQDFYMRYAVSTITERMFPFIDGLKPVQRRVLFTLNKLGLKDGKQTKSANVVGKTMGELHPHGDASIYEALCGMSDFHESLNAPLVHGANMGKRWSESSIPPAHMRYTESGLTKFAQNTYFDGLTKNAVDMIPNYLNDGNEPLLLPVKYPSIIVNSSKGIACGLSSYPVSYTLSNACEATIGLLRGTIRTDEELAQALGVPDFATGGTIGVSQKQLLELVKTGETRGIVITSRYTMLKGNVMHITEIPFNTTVEKIVSQIKQLVIDGSMQGVTRVQDTTGNMEMGIDITLKRGIDPNEVFKVLCAFTDVQKKISFSTKFVKHLPQSDGSMRFDLIVCGVRELLENYWIPWRLETTRRVYQHNLAKLEEEYRRIEAWKKINGRTEEYVTIIARNKKKDAMQKHMEVFGLTEEEEKILIGYRGYEYTQDEVENQLNKMEANLREQDWLKKLIESDSLAKEEIAKELEVVIKDYGTERRSAIEGLHQVVRLERAKKTISDKEVYVGLTKNMYLKRAETVGEINTFPQRLGTGDELTDVFHIRNNDKLMVFTTYGYVYKVLVNNIDNGPKTKFRDSVWHLIDKDPEDKGDTFMVLPAGDYSSEFNIVYMGQRPAVRKIRTMMYRGKNVYKETFPGYSEKMSVIVKDNQFLLVTNKMRALFVNIEAMSGIVKPDKKNMFKTFPKLPDGEEVQYVVPLNELEGFSGKESYYSFEFTPIRPGDFKRKDLNSDGKIHVEETSYENEDMVETDTGTSAEDLIDIERATQLFLSNNAEDDEDDDYDEDYYEDYDE